MDSLTATCPEGVPAQSLIGPHQRRRADFPGEIDHRGGCILGLVLQVRQSDDVPLVGGEGGPCPLRRSLPGWQSRRKGPGWPPATEEALAAGAAPQAAAAPARAAAADSLRKSRLFMEMPLSFKQKINVIQCTVLLLS